MLGLLIRRTYQEQRKHNLDWMDNSVTDTMYKRIDEMKHKIYVKHYKHLSPSL